MKQSSVIVLNLAQNQPTAQISVVISSRTTSILSHLLSLVECLQIVHTDFLYFCPDFPYNYFNKSNLHLLKHTEKRTINNWQRETGTRYCDCFVAVRMCWNWKNFFIYRIWSSKNVLGLLQKCTQFLVWGGAGAINGCVASISSIRFADESWSRLTAILNSKMVAPSLSHSSMMWLTRVSAFLLTMHKSKIFTSFLRWIAVLAYHCK